MKLKKVRITEFKSVWDSNSFDVGKVTCLVGKNEAGKTALLQALYRLNPIVEADGVFNDTHDYPRSAVKQYQRDVKAEERGPATVVTATFDIQDELPSIERAFGAGVVPTKELVLTRGYDHDDKGKNPLHYALAVDERAAVVHLCKLHGVPEAVASKCSTVKALKEELASLASAATTQHSEAVARANALTDDAQKAKELAEAEKLREPPSQAKLGEYLATLKYSLSWHVWASHLHAHVPKFFYFDEYYQLTGHDNLDKLRERKKTGALLRSDHPLLGLIELATLDLDQVVDAKSTQDLKNDLQGASSHLSKKILKYWSQNKHLRMMFDVRPARAGDPEGMREGTNIWGEVFDEKRDASTGLGTRSKGFVWFFSFLAWYSTIKATQPIVLLLDEPGLSLHGKAQEDLLGYFEKEIVPNPKHQLLYSTHSPFMVDPQHFDRVRIVQDKGIEADGDLTRDEEGTKVFTEVLDAGPDSLFPLQGALGYEVYQTLFIGPNCLIVEGVSDLLYIETVSGALRDAGREGLDERWTITPVGGAEKVPTFVALIGAQKKMNLATLIDYQKSGRQQIENLYKRSLLKKKQVCTYADFTGKTEADVEDMFDEDFYLQLVNGEYAKDLQAPLTPATLTAKSPRILVRIEAHLEAHPLKGQRGFSHFGPARYLAQNPAVAGQVPAATLERFEVAFKALNALLKK